MSEFIVANSETGEEKPWPRKHWEPIVDLQTPPWYVLEVIREPIPAVAEGWVAVPIKTQDFENGRLVYSWQIEQLPPPGPDYQRFYDDLIASQAYRNVTNTPNKSGDLSYAALTFLAALNENKSGRENVESFQAAIWLLFSYIALSAEDITELQGLMVQHRLSGIYTLEPPQ
jgi:hypothetical protein